MNAIEAVRREGLIDRFLQRSGLAGRGVNLSILENPTEEIDHARSHGKALKLHRLFGAAAPVPQSREIRQEENYLYSTRRFPYDVADNTIGSGALVSGDYDFFGNGVGDAGNTMGYFSLQSLTYMQTNMEKGGKIPKGRGYKSFELGISFNASAIAADIVQILDVASFKYDKGGSAMVINHGPALLWPGGVGVSGFAAAATTASTTTITKEAASNGLPSLTALRRWRNPRVLEPNDTFKYILTVTANTPKANAAVALSNFVEVRFLLFGYQFDVTPQ
jgi:hypothetical protein